MATHHLIGYDSTRTDRPCNAMCRDGRHAYIVFSALTYHEDALIGLSASFPGDMESINPGLRAIEMRQAPHLDPAAEGYDEAARLGHGHGWIFVFEGDEQYDRNNDDDTYGRDAVTPGWRNYFAERSGSTREQAEQFAAQERRSALPVPDEGA